MDDVDGCCRFVMFCACQAGRRLDVLKSWAPDLMHPIAWGRGGSTDSFIRQGLESIILTSAAG